MFQASSSCAHWAGEALAMEDPGQGGPLPPLRPGGVVQGGGAGVPLLGNAKGLNKGLEQPPLTLGLKCLRGQPRASIESHALQLLGWRQALNKDSLKVVRAKWEDETGGSIETCRQAAQGLM